MGGKKMVNRNVAVAVGIICVILAACLTGTFAYYLTMVNDNNTVSSLNSQVTALENQIQSGRSTINSLNSQIAELDLELASNNSTVASDNATIASLQSQITTLQNQVKSHVDQITELSNNLDSLQSQYEQLNQTYTSSFLFSSSGALNLWGMPSPNNAGIPQIFITYPAGFQEYADAILKICDTALSDYSQVFYMYNNDYYDRPPTISIFIYTNSSTALSTTPWDYRIYVYAQSIGDMSGFHVYGFIHELGHITFLTNNSEFNEGWAYYATSFRILPEVYSQLGNDAWPIPYNYSQTEGSASFLNEINNASVTIPGTIFAAAKILYVIDQEYGPLIFRKAMDMCHPSLIGFYHYPAFDLNEFKNALASLTNDTSLSQLFKENGF